MKATVSIREPLLLRDMRVGHLFALLMPDDSECVCVRASSDSPHGVVGLVGTRPDEVTRTARFAAEMPSAEAAPFVVSVIACRVGEGERGYRVTGSLLTRAWDCHVIPLEQVEKVAFRELNAAV